MKLFSLCLAIIMCLAFFSLPLQSQASDDHKKLETVFNELCSQTENAEALSVEEITTMIAECDSLKDKIIQSSHPKKKILLFRLKKCRNFLDFIIQTKQLKSSDQ